MTERGRIALLIAIMSAATLLTVGITIGILYRVVYNEQKEQLVSSVRNRARMMESVASFDMVYSKNYPSGPHDATIRQITEAYKHYSGFRKTWEFVIGEKRDDRIVFLVSHRKAKVGKRDPVPWDSELAEPMRLALSGKSGIIVGRDYAGKEVFAAYEPVDVLNAGLVIKMDLDEVRAPFLRAGLIAVLVTLFIVMAGAALFVKIAHPIISILERQSERLRNRNLLLKQAVREKELEMAAMYEKLLRREKLAVIGQLTGSIAHELRNPLSAVKQSVYFLNRMAQRGKLESAKAREHLGLIESEINTSAKVIDDILSMTRLKPADLYEQDLRLLTENARDSCGIPNGIRVVADFVPDPFRITADGNQMRQLLANLFTNAVQAMGEEGRITIRARMSGTDAEIEISDTGTGIEPENLDRVFDPLFTAKASGTGLGLCICKQIVENHNGEIDVLSAFGKGTTVRVILPYSSRR